MKKIRGKNIAGEPELFVGQPGEITVDGENVRVHDGQTPGGMNISSREGGGRDGKSAYQLAVEVGYNGTLEQWLDDLKADDTGVVSSGVGEPTELTDGTVYYRNDGVAGRTLYIKDANGSWTTAMPPRVSGIAPMAGEMALFGDDGVSIKTSGIVPMSFSEGTFDTSFAFDTVGDLSVSYTRRNGRYTRIGDLVMFDISMLFTPTYTTASGSATINGLPFASNAQVTATIGAASGITYPVGRDQLIARVNSRAVQLRFIRSGNTHNAVSVDSIVSGNAVELFLSGFYKV